MRLSFRFACLTLTAIGIAAPLAAEPVEWRVADGGNGHFYEFIDGPKSKLVPWPEARAYAASLKFRGVNGHLATITSLAEHKFLKSAFPSDGETPNGAWLGGFQDKNAADYAEPRDGWKWITGEPWGFTAWADSEPNEINGRGTENYLEFVPVWNGAWNDEGQERRIVVEYPVAAASKTKPQSHSETSSMIGSGSDKCSVSCRHSQARRFSRFRRCR